MSFIICLFMMLTLGDAGVDGSAKSKVSVTGGEVKKSAELGMVRSFVLDDGDAEGSGNGEVCGFGLGKGGLKVVVMKRFRVEERGERDGRVLNGRHWCIRGAGEEGTAQGTE
ncbi:hypothetical protein DsansV1_C03g0030591 [Dioscorea sansibarensis]